LRTDESISKRLRAAAAGVAMLALSAAGFPQGSAFSPESVKAAFLYRFASYVEWPAEAAAAPFVIGVVGADDIADQLEQLVARIKIRGQPVELRRDVRVSDLASVHILYVGPRALGRTHNLRDAAARRPILIVTDDANGFAAGGVINFVPRQRNVRFEISLVAADRAGLKIDSALLAVAARVERRPQADARCLGSRCAIRVATMAWGENR